MRFENRQRLLLSAVCPACSAPPFLLHIVYSYIYIRAVHHRYAGGYADDDDDAGEDRLDTLITLMAAQQHSQEETNAALTSILERSREDARIQKLQAALQIMVSSCTKQGLYNIDDILLSPYDEIRCSTARDKCIHIIKAAIAGEGAYCCGGGEVATVLMRLTGLQARVEEDRSGRCLVYLD